MRWMIGLFALFLVMNYTGYAQCPSNNCNESKIKWVSDVNLNKCKFQHPAYDPARIEKIEVGIGNPKGSSYHCYYVETELCDTAACSSCTVEEIFKLMISQKQFVAPTKDTDPLTDCGVTRLDRSLFGLTFSSKADPILTTIYPKQYSIINHTVKVVLRGELDDEHILHPGKIQRTIFKRGNKIIVGTMGEGNTIYRLINNCMGIQIWKEVDARLKAAIKCDASSSTLFLFDVSGSMAQNNKWQNAKQSALSALNSIRSQATAGNLKPSISIRAFDGDCNPDPTREVIGFTTDLTAVENAINNSVPPPGGGTPLPQSIKVSEDRLNAYLTANGIKKGKLIVLTDGASTCGSLRPQGVYGTGTGTSTQTSTTRSTGITSQSTAASSPSTYSAAQIAALAVNYYAVGFDIPPGSEAERDLQYLVQQNGGKYLNAQNPDELTDAFYIFNRVYVPKPLPAVNSIADADKVLFTEGVIFINDEQYDKAWTHYQQYTKINPKDFNGIYNLALMCEANERYKGALKNYDSYLQLNAGASDKPFVNEVVQRLRERVKWAAAYHKKVVKSDMEYLDLHFKKVQNGESITLAIEFIGFLKEKYEYYRNLPSIAELDDRNFKLNANEVFKGLKECVETINRNPKAWDRDATPVLSKTYLNMERLYGSF